MIAVVLVAVVSTASQTAEITDYINQRNCDQVLDKGYYKRCYDYSMKGAKYVGYTLDSSKVNSVNIKKRPRFTQTRQFLANTELPQKISREMNSMLTVAI